ncbi:Neutral ceramidase-like protein [Emericellopsis cladophorae]|uniref:Neutral ceramidase n=1 Tax=Emericellopsis cladophorae TaxID=2686198 RepID=A0A9P9Y6I2_9HYPO|nr:Neutral ceramidase-like protein [Emericellopsis cladophorae]KAI6784483.1 Neutral ceramidase-like protein [Emericellopsis cladophorae]
MLASLLFLVLAAAVAAAAGPRIKTRAGGDKYLIGVGKADITGPVVEIGFAGYADLAQTGSGLRQRLYSRAFIVGDINNPDDRFVYLVLDVQSGDTAMRYGILEALEELGDDYAMYGQHNVAVTGTHSHAGPGAWFNYLLPQITTFGFDKQSYQAIVDGAILSIQRAQESLQEGYLDVATADVVNGAINRSLFAYQNNPEEERNRYADSVDTKMTVLRFQRASDNKDMGVLTWHAVHATSMLGNSTHAAGDNKGLASWMLERDLGENDNAADDFVAAFSQANHADTSPNVLGAFCDDGSGMECDFERSTCADGAVDACHGRGPKFEALDLGVSSCHEIATRLASAAKEAYDSFGSTSTPIVGSSVKSFHFFHNMSFWDFALPDGKAAQTCPAALGYSFAAGTSDWPGMFDFSQGDSGDPDANPLWAVVKNILRTPSPEQEACQGEKPVLLDIGEMFIPYAWGPNIVDIQAFRVGQFVIVTSPSEVGTMAGRRWREAVAAEAEQFLDEEPIVVLTSPANTYAHYVTTPEEYDIQRYEGASTLYGRHSLDAYINLTVSNLQYLTPDATERPAPGPPPPDNREKALSFITGVVKDGAPIGQKFGSVRSQPASSYDLGDVVKATFQGANPRNNLRLEGTFVAVERLNGNTWTQVRDDADWFLVYTWRRTNFVLGYSEVDVTWETSGNAEPGTYRFKYYGDAKNLLGRMTAFQGTSGSFELS